MSAYKKLLLITSEFPPGPGGIGNHAFNLAKYLSLNGIKVKVLTISDYTDIGKAKAFDDYLPFEIERFERFDSRIKTLRTRIKKIKTEYSENKYGIVIFSGRFSLYSSLFLKKKDNEIKFVAIAHGTDVNPGNAAERKFVRKALLKMDLIIPVSEFSRSKLPGKINPEKISVIPNGFDIDGMDKINVKPKSINAERLNLISVGSVSPRKGQHNVLNAFRGILIKYPYARYSIAGRITNAELVEKFLSDKNFKDKINITGQVTNKVLYEMLNDSDIFILLSETQSTGSIEGFGIAILEANFFGLPVIGTANSGIAEAVDDGKTGILVDPKNPEEIINSISKILDDYQQFSKNSIEWAKKHHWSEIIKRYINVFKRL